MLKDIWIDGTDGSWKDEAIKFLNQFWFMEIRCWWVWSDITGKKKFGMEFLLQQYQTLQEWISKHARIVANRTFVSFIAWEILDGNISPDSIQRRYTELQSVWCFRNTKHVIIERPPDAIIESLSRRVFLAEHEVRFMKSPSLLREQQDVYREIWKKVWAFVVNNNGNITMLTKKIHSLIS